MYLSFYGLREAPFAPTPDPKFLFQSPRHREALAQLIYGVRERKGFIVLTGEIGTGKTTLLRTLLERLDATTPVAYVHNSRSEEHTSELQSRQYLVCRLLLEKKKTEDA